MVHKPKISRKKKKKIKGKKTLVKKDVFEDEKNNLPISYPKKYLLFQLVSLLLLTFIVYSGTLDHSFQFDDEPNIWDNHFIQISSLSFDNLVTAGFKSVNAKRPVANISFALNYYFHGLDVRGYHFVNIIIHLLAGIMLYYFVKNTLCIQSVRDKFGEAGFVPFYTALIWMVHPLHTQSVTYIVQRITAWRACFS